jgi:hypothetical protein
MGAPERTCGDALETGDRATSGSLGAIRGGSIPRIALGAAMVVYNTKASCALAAMKFLARNADFLRFAVSARRNENAALLFAI